MVRLRRKLSEEHKFILSIVINLQIFLVFGIIIATLVLLESRVLGHVGNDISHLLKCAYFVVFSLELILTVVYHVCSYFWKQELFGVYVGEYYKLKEGESSKDEQ